MDIDVYRSICENYNDGAPHVHHRNLGSADKIINNFADLHLGEDPGPETTQSQSFCDEDGSLDFGLEIDENFSKEERNPTLWKELAHVALEKYRERQGVEFELVGEVDAYILFKWRMSCFHLHFQAKSNGDSAVRFFAEVFWSKGGDCHVSFSGIMDPSNSSIFRGCRGCERDELHPNGVKFFEVPYGFVRGGASDDSDVFCFS